MRVINGLAIDAENRPVRDVDVAARGGAKTVTDSSGHFRLRLPSDQATIFDLRRPGYTPSQYAIEPGDDTSIVVVMLPAARQLAKVDVVDRAASSANLRGFDERMRERFRGTNVGTFITSADIDRRKPVLLTSMLTEIPGIRILKIGMSRWAAFGIARNGTGGSPCLVTLYVDGQRVAGDAMDELLTPLDVAGIEVYST